MSFHGWTSEDAFKQALDEHITGHWSDDAFSDDYDEHPSDCRCPECDPDYHNDLKRDAEYGAPEEIEW